MFPFSFHQLILQDSYLGRTRSMLILQDLNSLFQSRNFFILILENLFIL